MGQCQTQNLETEIEGRQSIHPLFIPHVLEEVCNFLPFQDLKSARMVNHFWYRATTPAWSRKAKMSFADFDKFRDWMAKTTMVKKVLPYNVDTWVFQGEMVTYLWKDEGLHERDLMIPFWPLIKRLELSNWIKKRYRIQPYDPVRRRDPYWALTRIASAYAIKDTLKMCTNLTHLVIDFAPLAVMKGKHMGPRQFPQLEKLTNLKIFYNGTKWSNTASGNQQELLGQNLLNAEPKQHLPPDLSGGNTLIHRILIHSPRLSSIIVTSGTSMSTRMESWFTRHLLVQTVILPILVEYRCMIPLQDDICRGLQARPWGFKTLQLKSHPGTGVSAEILYDMLTSFRNTLQHLELIFIGNPAEGEHSGHLFSGYQLCNLETLKMWGYKGDYSFLQDLPKLRSAVIGVTDAGHFETLQNTFRDMQIPNVNLELKTIGDFIMRLDEGPLDS